MLYMKYISMHMKSQMQHKASFFMLVLGQFLASFTTLLGVWFMFSRFNEVESFTFEQTLIGFAVILMSFALAECFGRGFDSFPRMISNGEFDRALARPRQIIFQVLASQIELSRLGRLTQAVLVFAYAIPACGVVWTWDKILTLALMILGGSVVFFCLFLIYAAFSFFTIEGLEFMNVFTHGGCEFGRYPFAVYGEHVLRVLTYVVPLALFQYYPLLYLLGRETGTLYMLAPLLGLLFAIPAYAFWRFGLRRYKSTGS